MILTNATFLQVGSNIVDAIVSVSASFFQCIIYSFPLNISKAISGTIGVIKNGSGTLTLSGVCNYTGPTQINSGQITISSASTLNGVISGVGQLTKTGATALTIGGINTYSGGTLSAPSAATGTISFAQNNAFGTGVFTSAGPSQIVCSANATLSNNFQINSGNSMQFRVNAAAITLTISGSIAGSGSVNKTSTGRLHLDGTLNYTGSTGISAGLLRTIKTVGASTATATFPAQGLSLAVSFNVSPPSGTTDFRFFQGTTVQSYASVTLTGVPVGTTASYNSGNSTLSVIVP